MSFYLIRDTINEAIEQIVADHNRPKTILLVEDSFESAEMQRFILAKSGARIVVVSNVGDAVSFLKVAQPDLILTDLGFPEKQSGFALLSFLRSSINLSAVPTIVVSGKKDAKTKSKAIGMGAADFLLKPVVPRVLLERVQWFL